MIDDEEQLPEDEANSESEPENDSTDAGSTDAVESSDVAESGEPSDVANSEVQAEDASDAVAEEPSKETSSEAVDGAEVASETLSESDASPVSTGSTEEPVVAEADAGQGEASAANNEADQVDVVAEETAIRHELGIGGGRIEIDQADVEKLLEEAVVGYEEIFAGTVLGDGPDVVAKGAGADLGEIGRGGNMLAQNLSLLRDVNLKVKVELGRGRMYLKDILRLAQGSVVELERLAGDPLDIYVNEKIIARGEVLVLNENFCIRITEIHNPASVLANGA